MIHEWTRNSQLQSRGNVRWQQPDVRFVAKECLLLVHELGRREKHQANYVGNSRIDPTIRVVKFPHGCSNKACMCLSIHLVQGS